MFENDIEEGVDGLININNGMATQSYDVDILAYFNVKCNENYLDYFPVRIYLLDGVCDIKYNNSQIDEMAYVKIYNGLYDDINIIKSESYEIINNYTDLYWDFQLNYLIKATSIDKMNEVNEDYFVYNQNGINKILNVNEINMVNEYWSIVQTNGILRLEDLNAEQLFKKALKIIRGINLYARENFNKDKYVTYGDYELCEN